MAGSSRAPHVPPLSLGQEGISSSKAAADRFRGSRPSAHQATLMLRQHPASSSLPGLGEEGPMVVFFQHRWAPQPPSPCSVPTPRAPLLPCLAALSLLLLAPCLPRRVRADRVTELCLAPCRPGEAARGPRHAKRMPRMPPTPWCQRRARLCRARPPRWGLRRRWLEVERK